MTYSDSDWAEFQSILFMEVNIRYDNTIDKILTGTKINVLNKLISVIFYFDHYCAAVVLDMMETLIMETQEPIILTSNLVVYHRHGYLYHIFKCSTCVKLKLVLCYWNTTVDKDTVDQCIHDKQVIYDDICFQAFDNVNLLDWHGDAI